MGRRQDGQIFPLMGALLLTVVALGFALFQVARGAVLRSEAQTAADAAALAGARNARDQLLAMTAAGGFADPMLVNEALVKAAAVAYARKNGAEVVDADYSKVAVDLKVRVRTKAQLGDDAAPYDSEDVKGAARGRARVETVSDGLGVASAVSGAVGGGGGASGGDGKVSKDEWRDFEKEELDGKPPTCKDAGSSNDVIKLGKLLQDNGFQIIENSAFDSSIGKHANGSYHYRCDGAGALDVNFDGGGQARENGAIDGIVKQIQDLGFRTIWQAPDHYDHLHVDSGTGNIGMGGAAGGFGFGDQTMEVRLIDWDAAFEDFMPPGGLPGAQRAAGPPDPAVAKALCRALDRYDAGPVVRLATFEAAIVESGVHNLDHGDRDSLGVFQQRPLVGEWGTAAQIMDVDHAAMKFITTAQSHEPWSASAGMLAYAVQRCAWEYRFRYDENRDAAAAMLEKYCG